MTTVTLHVVWMKWHWEKEFRASFYTFEPDFKNKQANGCTYIYSGQIVEVECPEPPDRATQVTSEVSALRAEQGKHQAAITDLERRIGELLSLEHKK